MEFPQQQGWTAMFRRSPGKRALDGVTFEVAEGEIFGLLGPNGAGKTTLIKILSTLTIPTAGEAFVGDANVVIDSIAVRKRIGVVYGDERTFFWRLSALENLIFYGSLYGMTAKEARRRGLELLDMVGLAEHADLRMHHYSSGMKQRISIARGLLHDPRVLIMDEPTRALDPIAAQELRRLVRERVVVGGRTVLIATNIMAEAESLCDRVAFVAGGRIELLGELAELRALLQQDELNQLVVSGVSYAALDGLRAVSGVASLKLVPLEGDQYRLDIRARRDSNVVPACIRKVVEAGGDVWACAKRELTLDEIFALVVAAQQAPARPEAVAS